MVELGRVDAAPPAPPSFAKGNAASRMVFAAFDARWGAEDLQSRKFHPAPAAQWVVYLEGVMSITVTTARRGTLDRVTCSESKTRPLVRVIAVQLETGHRLLLSPGK
jgi:hypothetical protein